MSSCNAPAEPSLACQVPLSYGPASSRAKRLIDIVGAVCGIVFLGPLLLLVSALIIVDSRGPVLFRQWRTGLGGRPFRIYKFRSMTCAEDGPVVVQAQKSDVRVTRIGAFIRRTSIDELPQLFNVMRGDMSLVGPRPHAVSHDVAFQALTARYQQRFQTRPGITGLAQASGFRGELKSAQDVLRRSALDNRYVDQWSLVLDVSILVKTAAVVLFQRTAY